MLKNKLKRYIPQVIIDLVTYVKSFLEYLKIKEVLACNRILKNIFKNEAVYIIGNGPSLNNFELQSIHGQCVITMNHFELHPHKDKFKIVAHCIGEPYNSETWEDPMLMINGVEADTYWVNADALTFFSKKNIKNIHYYLPGVRSTAEILNGMDLTRVALQYQSTSQMAINIALYFGFKKIYLLGLDHDWLVTRGYSPHFYDDTEDIPKINMSMWTYTEMIKISLNLFETYAKIKKNSETVNAKIINLSSPSYLDVFPTKM
jgi:hypothetical protein